MRRSTIGVTSLAALTGLAVFAIVGGVASGAPDVNGSNAQSNSVKTVTHDCAVPASGQGGGMMGDDFNMDHDTIAFDGPTVLWPPNHKYRTVTITSTDVDGAVDPGDHVTATTTAASDQLPLEKGSGHTLDDTSPATQSAEGQGQIVQTVQLRGERSGRLKPGRTYTIKVMATFDGPGTMMSPMDRCSAQFTVTVPHDMGNH